MVQWRTSMNTAMNTRIHKNRKFLDKQGYHKLLNESTLNYGTKAVKRDGDKEKTHYEQFHNLRSSPDIIMIPDARCRWLATRTSA